MALRAAVGLSPIDVMTRTATEASAAAPFALNAAAAW